MSINNATPNDWDRATKSQTPHDMEDFFDPYDQPLRADPVNAPPHYNTGNIECIEAIKESMTSDAFKGYCKGNALKYVWRMSYKGKPIEDLRKAIWYIERLIESELEHPTILKK